MVRDEAWLVVEHPDGRREHQRLTLTLTTIGRSDQNVIELLDPKLSRFHCEVERRGDTHFVRDCNSRNGTVLNGEPVRGPAPLDDGDVVSLGRSRVVFSLSRPEELRSDPVVAFRPLGAGEGEEPPEAEVTAELETPATGIKRPTQGFDPRRTVTLREITPRLHDEDDPWRRLAALCGDVTAATSRAEVLEGAVHGVRALLQARGALLATGSEQQPESLTVVASEGLEAEGRERCVEVARRVLDTGERLLSDRRSIGVPVTSQGRFQGVLAVHDLPREPVYGSDEVAALVLFAGIVGSTLAGSTLLEEVRREERGAGARRIAHDLRSWLRSGELPHAPGVDLAAATLPTEEVGRDVVVGLAGPGEDGARPVYLAVGDVPAPEAPLPVRLRRKGERGLVSLLGQTELRGALRCLLDAASDAGDVLTGLDRSLREGASVSDVSVLLARYDPGTGSLGFAGAGCEPLLLRRASGQVEAFPATRPALGAESAAEATERAVDWQPGDAALLVTAGARASAERAFGEGGLVGVLEEVGESAESADELARSLLDRLAPADDGSGMTALVARRLPAA